MLNVYSKMKTFSAVYGWEIGELTAIERAEPYTVNVQLLKGRGTIFFANPIYRVVLEPGGNASMFIILAITCRRDKQLLSNAFVK